MKRLRRCGGGGDRLGVPRGGARAQWALVAGTGVLGGPGLSLEQCGAAGSEPEVVLCGIVALAGRPLAAMHVNGSWATVLWGSYVSI